MYMHLGRQTIASKDTLPTMESPSPSTKEEEEPVFSLPVDADEKATVFRPFSIAPPHMRAFHLAWLSLFSCFFSTFSIPPLLAAFRHDLSLTEADISRASAASFAGTILSRLAMGPVCDLVGPRAASAALSLLTAPAILAMSVISSPQSFIIVRFVVGLSLANFVANQFWMTSMFSSSVVGLANGVSAGWASTGSGLTQLLMPLIYSLMIKSFNVSSTTAWRLAYVVPATFQIITAILVLAFGQDRPYNKADHGKEHVSARDSLLLILLHGLRNYRGWILALVYGFSFGVELTMYNVIAGYFSGRFGVNIEVAGVIAAGFGMTNVFARPMGGKVSDEVGRRFGMRGRLWGLWAAQAVAGAMCVVMGRVNSLWGSIGVMFGFSVLVQATSGLTFGVVPFVSKRSLGVILGMTGSGGTVGAVINQLLLFSDSKFSKQTSISLMGVMMILCSLTITLMYFPRQGGMFCGPSYDFDSDYRPLE